jgi:hypothetical protein
MTPALPPIAPVYKHLVVVSFVLVGIAVSWYIFLTTPLYDEWGRRWTLVLIPLLSGQGLLYGWSHRWRDVLLWLCVIYLGSPLIAARLESCLTDIPGAIPCFGDVVLVRELTSQAGHPVYTPALIALQTIGVVVLWLWLTRKGAPDASPGTPAD